MRFIIAIVDDFKMIPKETGAPDIEFYNLISYIDMEIDKLSLLELNRVLKRIRENKEMDTWDLPLLDNDDYNTLDNNGYAIVRRINHRIYEHRWILIFDLTHHKNARLLSIIRDKKLNTLI